VRIPIWLCTECGRALADAATARRKRGLPQRPAYSATCTDRCERTREERFRREAAARDAQLKRGEWRCEECGCTMAEAIAKNERKITLKSLVCSHACAERLKARAVAARMREVERMRKLAPNRPRPPLPSTWRCSGCGADHATVQRERLRRGLGVVPVNAVTCGAPECQRKHDLKRRNALVGGSFSGLGIKT